MIYRIGQRVRIIRADRHPETIGREGTIVLPLGHHEYSSPGRYGIEIDGCPCPVGPGSWFAVAPDYMVPLTDPKADEFIERIKKLKPLESCTLTPSDLERVRGGA